MIMMIMSRRMFPAAMIEKEGEREITWIDIAAVKASMNALLAVRKRKRKICCCVVVVLTEAEVVVLLPLTRAHPIDQTDRTAVAIAEVEAGHPVLLGAGDAKLPGGDKILIPLSMRMSIEPGTMIQRWNLTMKTILSRLRERRTLSMVARVPLTLSQWKITNFHP